MCPSKILHKSFCFSNILLNTTRSNLLSMFLKMISQRVFNRVKCSFSPFFFKFIPNRILFFLLSRTTSTNTSRHGCLNLCVNDRTSTKRFYETRYQFLQQNYFFTSSCNRCYRCSCSIKPIKEKVCSPKQTCYFSANLPKGKESILRIKPHRRQQFIKHVLVKIFCVMCFLPADPIKEIHTLRPHSQDRIDDLCCCAAKKISHIPAKLFYFFNLSLNPKIPRFFQKISAHCPNKFHFCPR